MYERETPFDTPTGGGIELYPFDIMKQLIVATGLLLKTDKLPPNRAQRQAAIRFARAALSDAKAIT